MKVEKTTLDGVLVVTPEIYEDFRGANMSIYNEGEYVRAGIDIKFVEDKVTTSWRNVLRGIHGDPGTWKFVACLYGEIHFVVVNCDESDPAAFGKWEAFRLSRSNRRQVLVPPIYGNAHLVMSEFAVFHYKWSEYYHPEAQFSYRFDDPRFKIPWPTAGPYLSERDALPWDAIGRKH